VGLTHSPAAVSDLELVRAAIQPVKTKLSGSRRPPTRLLNIGDIEALAAITHERVRLLVVDTPFASPYLQQPLTSVLMWLVHSTTKYCGGRSTSSGGAAIVRPRNRRACRFHENAMARCPGRSTAS